MKFKRNFNMLNIFIFLFWELVMVIVVDWECIWIRFEIGFYFLFWFLDYLNYGVWWWDFSVEGFICFGYRI